MKLQKIKVKKLLSFKHCFGLPIVAPVPDIPVAQYVIQIYLPHFKRNVNAKQITYKNYFAPFIEFKDNTYYHIVFDTISDVGRNYDDGNNGNDFYLTLKEIVINNLPYDTTYYEDTLSDIIDHNFGANFSSYDEVAYIGSEDRETSTLKIILF